MKRNNNKLAIKVLGGETGAYCCCPKANTLSVEEVLEDGKFKIEFDLFEGNLLVTVYH